LLTEVMVRNGFHYLDFEWWHFEDDQWWRYPIMDLPLELYDLRSSGELETGR